jgi:hypothetical protein
VPGRAIRRHCACSARPPFGRQGSAADLGAGAELAARAAEILPSQQASREAQAVVRDGHANAKHGKHTDRSKC